MGLALQSRTSKHGIGRIYTETAVGHGRVALLPAPIKKGGLPDDLRALFLVPKTNWYIDLTVQTWARDGPQ